MSSLASSLSRQGHYSEAEKLDRETLDMRRRVLGAQHSDTVDSMTNLAGDLFDQHHDSEADFDASSGGPASGFAPFDFAQGAEPESRYQGRRAFGLRSLFDSHRP